MAEHPVLSRPISAAVSTPRFATSCRTPTTKLTGASLYHFESGAMLCGASGAAHGWALFQQVIGQILQQSPVSLR